MEEQGNHQYADYWFPSKASVATRLCVVCEALLPYAGIQSPLCVTKHLHQVPYRSLYLFGNQYWNWRSKPIHNAAVSLRGTWGPLTTASLPGADRLDVVWWLPWIQEGDMSLGAHCIHWPLTTIGQAHILTAIWQFGREELKTEREEMHLWHYRKAHGRALFLDAHLCGLSSYTRQTKSQTKRHVPIKEITSCSTPTYVRERKNDDTKQDLGTEEDQLGKKVKLELNNQKQRERPKATGCFQG